MKNTMSMIIKRIKERSHSLPGPLFKVVRWLYCIPDLLLSIVVSLILRALRPVVLIRFGKLPNHRIGHFALEVEAYLCARDTRIHSQNTLDMFFYSGPICNQQLKKMWDRTLCTFWPGIAQKGYDMTSSPLLPGGKKHLVPLPRMSMNQHHIEGLELYGVVAQAPPHLQFTPEEIRQGHEAILALGVPKDAPFVCFHARDTAYYSAHFAHENDRNFRNSNIYTRLLAVEELTHRGYWGLRMGAAVEAPLRNDHPRIIDYATTARTDFLDIFLAGNCRFYLGDSCGIADVAVCFRRPVVWVNEILTTIVWSTPNALCLLKKLWLAEEHRFMTFREMSTPELARILFHDDYFEAKEDFFKDRYGIEFVENTSEEVTAVVLEMEERLQNTWQATEEDEELQRRFWAIVQPEKPYAEVVTRIGCEFLRQNQKLLE